MAWNSEAVLKKIRDRLSQTIEDLDDQRVQQRMSDFDIQPIADAPTPSAWRAKRSAHTLDSAPTLMTTTPRPSPNRHASSARRRRSSASSRSTSDTIAMTIPSAPRS